MRPILMILAILVGFSGGASSGFASVGSETGLPIPRFVTLRAEEVNLRTGPGVRYPIEWVYQRPSLPVQVIAEFDTWRKIRDVDGTEGWVHQSMLSGRRTVMVTGREFHLRRAPDAAASAVARVEVGVIGKLEECVPRWCEVEMGGLSGWIDRRAIWGDDEAR